MCIERHAWQTPKNEGRWTEDQPGSDEIDEATNAMQAWRSMLRHDNLQRLDDLIERKSLGSFVSSSAGWITPPQVSSSILSCLTNPADFLSLFGQEEISAGNIQVPIDNSEFEGAEWAHGLRRPFGDNPAARHE